MRTLPPARTLMFWAVLWVLTSSAAAAQTPKEQLEIAARFQDRNEYASAIEAYRAIPDDAPPEILLSRDLNIAQSLVNLTRFDEAQSWVDRARPVAERIGTDAARARVLNTQGQLNSWRGRGDRGLGDLLRAAELAQHEPRVLATIYGNLATTYQRFEDWERQMYYAEKQFALRPSADPLDQFDHAMDMGIGHFELYDRDAAVREFTKGLELAMRTGAKRNQSFARGELAYTYWTFDKDAGRALQFYGEAIALAAESKTAALEANWLNSRGNVYRDTGKYEAALADYRAANDIHTRAGLIRNNFQVRKNIAQVYRLQGRPREAAGELRTLLDTMAAQASPRQLWQAHMELASSLDALGDRAAAETAFKRMLDILEEQRNTAILDTFRTGSFAHALSTYDPYERYMRFLLNDSPARVAEALEVGERARSRGFLESLASVRGAVAAKLPPALLAEEARVTRAISTAQEQLRAADLPRVDRERVLAELERAEQERERFQVALRVEHPALAEARYPTLVDTKRIQDSLRPEDIVVVFFLAEPRSFRWVLSNEHVVFDYLPGRAAIEQQVSRLRDALRAPETGGAAKAAADALGAALFQGLTTTDERPMVIVPHGVLHYVPFEALGLNGRMAVERHAISYAPSLNALVQLRASAVNDAPFRVLAVGNPTSGTPAATERSADVANLSLLGPLPFAEQELQAIGRTFPDRTRILSGEGARESGLKHEDVSRYPVIHFATHGLVSDTQPKRSGLLLTPEAGEDGLLQMSEIYGLGLRANLVVLSACQTALGREITGEGLVGLSRAFFYAGARSVVAALWNLNDRFAAEFVQRFYRELNAGYTSEEALRRAKLAYVNHAQYSHPYYWSSLVALGDGSRPLVRKPVRPPMGLSVLSVLFGLAAVAITAAKVRKTAQNRPKSAIG